MLRTALQPASTQVDELTKAKIIFVCVEAERYKLNNVQLVMSHLSLSLADLLAISMGYKNPGLSSRKFLLAQLIASASVLVRGKGTPSVLATFNKDLAEYTKL